METYVMCEAMKNYERLHSEKMSKKKWEIVPLLSCFIFIIAIAYVSIVVVSLFFRTSLQDILRILKNDNTIEAIKISLFSVLCSNVIILFIGVPTAFIIKFKNNKFLRILEMIIIMPIVIPPSIAGLGLLMAFGRSSFIGLLLERINMRIPFTITAVIMAQVFVSTPFFIQTLKNRFENIDSEISEAALICGAGYKELLFHIYMPISKRAIATGLIMSILRALGEFGATMMFAGNLTGKTQTIPTLIYTYAQHNSMEAVAMAVIHIMLFIIPLTIIYVGFQRKAGE